MAINPHDIFLFDTTAVSGLNHFKEKYLLSSSQNTILAVSPIVLRELRNNKNGLDNYEQYG